MDRLADVKISLALGDFTVDSILESIIENGGRLLQMIASTSAREEGDHPELPFAAMVNDLNIGVVYTSLERLWLDVVWNDFRMSGDETQPVFASSEVQREKQRAESWFRHVMTTVQAEVIPYVRALATGSGAIFPDVQATITDGRFTLTTVPGTNDSHAWRTQLEISTLPVYYQAVVNRPGPKYQRLTLLAVAQGYALLKSIAQGASHHAAETLTRGQQDPSAKVTEGDFAPVVARDHLRTVLSATLAIASDVAEEMISFFTGAGQDVTRGLDHWMAPLVALSKTTLTIFPQAVLHANLRRLPDLWLRHLGFDLDIRGLPFEAHVRDALQKASRDSSLSALTHVLASEFVLRPDGSREEEIDLVVVLGDRLVIGEAKCFLQPSTPVDQHNHWDKLCEAVAQVARKAKAVRDFDGAFRAGAQRYGLTLPETMEVLPLVVLNHAIDVGHLIEGVPVVDLRILEMFFEGALPRNAMLSPTGEVESAHLDFFYRSAGEAPAVLAGYLNDPPQLRHLHGTVASTEENIVLPTTASGFARVRRYEVSTDRIKIPTAMRP